MVQFPAGELHGVHFLAVFVPIGAFTGLTTFVTFIPIVKVSTSTLFLAFLGAAQNSGRARDQRDQQAQVAHFEIVKNQSSNTVL